MGDELLHHPPYSLCLALSDYFLSPKFNKRLSGKRFGYNEEIIVQTSVKKFTGVCEALTEEIKRFFVEKPVLFNKSRTYRSTLEEGLWNRVFY